LLFFGLIAPYLVACGWWLLPTTACRLSATLYEVYSCNVKASSMSIFPS